MCQINVILISCIVIFVANLYVPVTGSSKSCPCEPGSSGDPEVAETCDDLLEHVENQVNKDVDSSQTCMSDSSVTLKLNDLDDKEPTVANMALVLYDDSVISPFHKDERKFSFGVKQVVIKQDWQQVGVAAVVWDAAVVLGEHLMEHADLVRGKRILELGAGTGLAGLVAAIAGGIVTLTDRQMALKTLEVNTEANRVSHPDMDITISELEWGEDYETKAAYDIILGADIIYIEETFDALLKTLTDYSTADTQILISCKIRYDRDKKFLNLLRQQFTVEELHHDQTRDILIFDVKKNKD